MRKTAAIRTLPAAQNIEAILDIIMMIVNIIQQIVNLFGVNLTGLFGGGK